MQHLLESALKAAGEAYAQREGGIAYCHGAYRHQSLALVDGPETLFTLEFRERGWPYQIHLPAFEIVSLAAPTHPAATTTGTV